jgi:uncharacterized protein (TIGR00288 family)
MKENLSANNETRVALLVDCDNVSPNILEYALLMAAQFGRIILRRGYGNHSTLANEWQKILVQQAFTPCLQYQYSKGKNTADIALALDAQEVLFDGRADIFCIVTSDSDFAYLCRKLRERGATVCIVGEEGKTPDPLRNACDRFFGWLKPKVLDKETVKAPKAAVKPEQSKSPSTPAIPKTQPSFVTKAVTELVGKSPDGKVTLSALGKKLKQDEPEFSSKNYGYPKPLNMVRAYDSLVVTEENGIHWVSLAAKAGNRKDNVLII